MKKVLILFTIILDIVFMSCKQSPIDVYIEKKTSYKEGDLILEDGTVYSRFDMSRWYPEDVNYYILDEESLEEERYQNYYRTFFKKDISECPLLFNYEESDLGGEKKSYTLNPFFKDAKIIIIRESTDEKPAIGMSLIYKKNIKFCTSEAAYYNEYVNVINEYNDEYGVNNIETLDAYLSDSELYESDVYDKAKYPAIDYCLNAGEKSDCWYIPSAKELEVIHNGYGAKWLVLTRLFNFAENREIFITSSNAANLKKYNCFITNYTGYDQAIRMHLPKDTAATLVLFREMD